MAQGKPAGVVKNFNGRVHDKLLKEIALPNLGDAREKLAAWADDYNILRPQPPNDSQTLRAMTGL